MMKKLIAVLLVACSLLAFAQAETDLSSMTFDDLVSLSHKIAEEIMSRPEWKEVTVPGGTWIVGQDIPAGTYSILPTKMGGYVHIEDSQGKLVASQGVRNADNTIGKITLLDGYVVEIENGSVILAPALSLGF